MTSTTSKKPKAPATSLRRHKGEGTVYFEKARDRWVGAIEVDGQRKKVTALTEAETRKKLDRLRLDAEDGKPIGDGNATVNDALDKWIERGIAARDLAPKTEMMNLWCCKKLRTELGTKRLRSLTADDIEDAFDRLASPKHYSRPLAHGSLIKVRSTLGMTLDFAERRGMVSRNVARMASLPRSAKRTKKRRSLTIEEVARFDARLGTERLGPMFMLMSTIGLRPGEAAGLLWPDIKIKTGTITVDHGVRMNGNTPYVSDELKTAGSRRTITLPTAVLAAMRAHRLAQDEERMAAPIWADPRLVFASRNGTVLSPSNIRRELKRICIDAGIADINPNELRHTAASLLADAGVSNERIASLLGHSTTRMVDQTYTHNIRPSIDVAVETMDRRAARNIVS